MQLTTVPLTSKFLGELDRLTDDLIRVFHAKGGAAGRKIRAVMAKLHNVSIFWSNLTLFDSAIWESSFVNGLEKDRHFQNYCVVNWLRTVS